jgi:porphobilinogen deaminase
MTKITIGARGSKLSLAYVAKVKDLLLQEHKNLTKKDITVQTIKTSGDINQNILKLEAKTCSAKRLKKNY